MRFLIYFSCAVMLASPLVVNAALPTPAPGIVSDGVSFTVASRTEVPGAVLKPGTYAIRVVDHLSDRVILSVDDASGRSLATFLGLPNPAIRSAASTGAINWPNGPHKQDALRGFAFPGGNAVEFVYPKADAVEIAKVNTSKVAAIDPASEGHTANSKKLSAADLQTLTLWSLSSTRVGPENGSQPAISAERYQPVQEARNTPPPMPGTRGASGSDPAPQDMSTSQPKISSTPRMKPVSRKPALAVLPHTASDSPLILLSGIVALLVAGALRFGRRTRDEA